MPIKKNNGASKTKRVACLNFEGNFHFKKKDERIAHTHTIIIIIIIIIITERRKPNANKKHVPSKGHGKGFMEQHIHKGAYALGPAHMVSVQYLHLQITTATHDLLSLLRAVLALLFFSARLGMFFF
jgi:hypothetical protein